MEPQEYLKNLRNVVNAFLDEQTIANKQRVIELAEQRASIGLKHFQAEQAWKRLGRFEFACAIQPRQKNKLPRKRLVVARRRLR